MTRRFTRGAMCALAGVLALVHSDDAAACGCFTPPDPAVPVVQAGERIVFAVKDGQVTAHIQIQYQGDAAEFGWLLPLPSLPTLELGVDELFSRITTVTQPKYRLTRVYDDSCGTNRFGPGGGGAPPDMGQFAAGDGGSGGPSPLVVQDSIGPYDYAVLKADDQSAMLQWLKDNRYFVPTGTDTAVTAYTHPGAFFLALKLKSGKSTGDLQPVVVRYASDLPMIPIVLTSVGANPDMGIQVFMVGNGRAIPRNYYHTVLNDAVIDWLNFGANYNDVVIRATKEAPGRHTFVTEYAGSSVVMQNVLDYPQRFGSASDLVAIKDPVRYVSYLQGNGFSFNGVLIAILQKYIPIPMSLSADPGTYYFNLGYYLGQYRTQNPDEFKGLDFTLDSVKLTDELEMRVVKPTLAAGKMFSDFPYLTRLYTTLSPQDMNSDPVFSYNPSLPNVSNVHDATLTIHCTPIDAFYPSVKQSGTLQTAQGFIIQIPDALQSPTLPDMPASLRIEKLREEGSPELQQDNAGTIQKALGIFHDDTPSPGSCSVRPRGDGHGLTGLLALGLIALFIANRRRPRR